MFVPSSLVWPAGVGLEEFLASYWQRKPLVMPGALPGFVSPLEANELAGLACEDGVESRLVSRRDGQWWLKNGPFAESDLVSLPTADWSLLVQDVEKHLPDLAQVLHPFRFLPAWRLDDLMISCAAPGGSVGPHVDQYDVFLVQAQGRRRWQWNDIPGEHPLQEDSELALVQDFAPDREWVMEPGDVLYLPPGVPHHGVALEDEALCMTYSVGFRAPSVSEMLQDLARARTEQGLDLRYADPGLNVAEGRDSLIGLRALDRVRRMLTQAVAMDDAALAAWFGSLVTEPKAWMKPAAVEQRATPDQLIAAMTPGIGLRRHGMALWARWLDAEHCVLFVDGKARPLPLALAEDAALLCSDAPLPYTAADLKNSPALAVLLTDLFNEGVLEPDQED